MADSHYIANTGIASTSFLPELPVVATLPCAIIPVITPTYANQVPQGSQVMMELGTPEAITAALAGKELYAAKERAGQLEARIGELYKTVWPVWDNRALPFLAYLEQHGKVNKSSKVLAARVRSGRFTSQDLTQLTGMFLNSFPQNLTNRLTRDEIKARLMRYVADSEFDEQLLELLREVDKKGFEALPAYLALVNELKGMAQPEAAVSTLEEAVRRYKASNEGSETLTFLGRELNIAQAIEGMMGVKPAGHFLLTIDRLVEGEVKAGVVSPFQFRPNGKGGNVPEELKSDYYFLPVERLGQIITFFDVALRFMFNTYVKQNPETYGLAKEIMRRSKKDLPDGVLMRAVFPESHQPILALYPDSRVMIPKEQDSIRRLMKLVRNGVAQVPEVVAEQLKIPVESIKLTELIQLQTQITQLLPMPVYVAASVNSKFEGSVANAQKHRAQLTPEERVLLANYEIQLRKFQRDFGTVFGKVHEFSQAAPETAVRLFGEQFRFVEQVLMRQDSTKQDNAV